LQGVVRIGRVLVENECVLRATSSFAFRKRTRTVVPSRRRVGGLLSFMWFEGRRVRSARCAWYVERSGMGAKVASWVRTSTDGGRALWTCSRRRGWANAQANGALAFAVSAEARGALCARRCRPQRSACGLRLTWIPCRRLLEPACRWVPRLYHLPSSHISGC